MEVDEITVGDVIGLVLELFADLVAGEDIAAETFDALFAMAADLPCNPNSDLTAILSLVGLVLNGQARYSAAGQQGLSSNHFAYLCEMLAKADRYAAQPVRPSPYALQRTLH